MQLGSYIPAPNSVLEQAANSVVGQVNSNNYATSFAKTQNNPQTNIKYYITKNKCLIEATSWLW